MNNTEIKEKKVPQDDSGINQNNESVLVLHNDEVNTFDYVIESLIEICKHTPEQAVQCTFITHHKGKCDIKKGQKNKLRNYRMLFLEKGLKTTIE